MKKEKELERKSFIAALRFPLAVLVVLIHANNSFFREMTGGDGNAVIHFLSRVLPTFAVPLFFAMSGYLFFLNRNTFGVADYREKLRRRGLTLLLPYVLWNFMAFVLYALKDIIAGHVLQPPFSLNLLWGCKPLGTVYANFLGWTFPPATAPLLEQLWFVRDLMVCVLLAPFIYMVLKRGRVVGLVCIALVFYGRLWPNLCGLSFTGFWFFALGAWFSICGKDPLRSTRRLLAPASALVPPALLALVLWPDGSSPIHCLGQAVYVLAAMIVSIHVADFLSNRRVPGKLLPSGSFFIYASHTIVLYPLTALAMCMAAGHGAWMLTALYLLSALACVAVCLLFFYLLRRWLPRLSAPLTGIYEYRKIVTTKHINNTR